MTEKEFDQQVWRRYDAVTLDTGIETTIMNVCFATRSVRIYMKDSPAEWMTFARISSHKSRYSGNADDSTLIEELHNKCLRQQDDIERLKNEREKLKEKLGVDNCKELLTALHSMEEGLREKKHKIEMIESALRTIAEVAEKIKKIKTN
jgi:hypothetical protein